ncbi:MAG: flippase-like domain-containing protein [Chloroflexi bacterium]|nr:flippase-like domain-containing protein [Chloroflexota bacterium]
MHISSSSTWLRRLIPGVVFGFVILIALAFAGDLRQVSTLLIDFHWVLFPLALGLTLFNYLLRFYKFYYYLGQIGVTGLSQAQSLRLFVAGFPLAVTPGKVGEVFKGVWVNRASGVQVGKCISVVVAERVSDGLAMIVLSGLGVVAYPRYWPAFLAAAAVLAGVVVVSQVRPLALWFLGIGERLPVVRRFAHGLREFYEGSFALFRPRSTLVGVGLGTISWLGEGIGFYLILLGLGLAPGTKLLATAVFVLAFSTVIGAASTLPGGLGAVEVSIAGMLVVLAGLPADLASAATLLIRLATLWFGVGLGLLVWAFSKDLFRVEESALDAKS